MKSRFRLYKYNITPADPKLLKVYFDATRLIWSSYWERMVGENYPPYNFARYLIRCNKKAFTREDEQLYKLAQRMREVKGVLLVMSRFKRMMFDEK